MNVGEQYVILAILIIAALSVAFVLLGVQLRGTARDKLIGYMLEHTPDTVSSLESNERILRWTNRSKSLTVIYQENVLKDITYKYRDFQHDLVLVGKLKQTKDFDDMLIKVLCH